MNILFQPLTSSHFPLLVTWLNAPHVLRWWPYDTPWTLDSVTAKYETYTEGYKVTAGDVKPIHAFIIVVDDVPIGYIQYYDAYDFPRDNGSLKPNDLVPPSLAALDLFIGNPRYLGKGLGVPIIRTFLEYHVWPTFNACFVDPESDNIIALKVFAKAGFVPYQKVGSTTRMIARKPT